MSHLDLATCQQLRDAGLEQYPETAEWHYAHQMTPSGLGGNIWRVHRTMGSEFLTVAVCPNSDELIAAIQARWPGHDLSLHKGTNFRNQAGPDCYEGEVAHPWGARAYSGMWGAGDSPAAALAALYIALSEGERHAG